MDVANRGAGEAGSTTINMNIPLLFEQYPNEYISDGLAF
jgi:predicted Rossmann-fold nucleotide-binding protein